MCTSPVSGLKDAPSTEWAGKPKLTLAPPGLDDKATGVRGLRSGREGGRQPRSPLAVCTACSAQMQRAWPEAQAANDSYTEAKSPPQTKG